ALLVFAGDVHVVSPLTSDADTIVAMVSALNTEIMPLAGSRPDLAILKAGELLKQNGNQRGEIILLTDGIDREEASLNAARTLSEQGYRLSVLAIGTPEGAPIPMQNGGYLKDANGGIVMPRLTPGPLQQLASVGGGMYSPLTNTPKDLDRLLLPASTFDMGDVEESEDQITEAWREEGPWLLLLLLPLAALSFRRGWVIGIALTTTLTLMLIPPPAMAWEWRDLWQRPDQQGAQAMSQERPADAAELFEASDWQGAAHYRAGQYEEAAAAFAQLDTVDGHYNRGNALAKSGAFEQAIEAYETALERAPEHTQARENLELLKQMQQEQEQQQDQKGEQDQSESDKQESGEDNQDDSQNREGDQQGESQDGQSQESENAQQQREQEQEQQAQQQQGEEGEQEEQQQAQQQQKADGEQKDGEEEEAAKANANPMMTEEAQQQQLLEQYLKRIDDDPGGLLREKFRRQTLRQRGKVAPDDGQTW
ncbi:MAG: tetratricopeptide repeat protein, partial [Pseudomonadota bacterium]